MTNQLSALRTRLAAGEAVMLVHVAEIRGSAPRDAGARMLVGENDIHATIGGGELEYELAVTKSDLAVATARLNTTERLLARAPEDRASKSLNDLSVARIEASEAIKVADSLGQIFWSGEMVMGKFPTVICCVILS